MVRIFNLESLGTNLFSDIYNLLSEMVNSLNSEYYKQTEIEHIQNRNWEFVQLETNQSTFLWNIFIDNNLNLDIQSQIKENSKAKTEYKIHQNVLITNKLDNNQKDIDVVIVSQKDDLKILLSDYLSVLEGTRFPKNLELEDFFEITKGKTLEYCRLNIYEENSKIKFLFEQNLKKSNLILYYKKRFDNDEKLLQKFNEIWETFYELYKDVEIIECTLERNYNEVSTLAEFSIH